MGDLFKAQKQKVSGGWKSFCQSWMWNTKQ